MAIFKRKSKLTKAELTIKKQRKREFKVMMYGGLCGLIVAITPILAIGLTPGHITKDYLGGQILFSSSSGGASTSMLNQLITDRINHVTTAPLSVMNTAQHNNILQSLFLQQQDLGINRNSSWTVGSLLLDIQRRVHTLAVNQGLPPYAQIRPQTQAPVPNTNPNPGVPRVVVNTQTQEPGVYIAQTTPQSIVQNALVFQLASEGADGTLNKLVVDVSTGQQPANDQIGKADLFINSVFRATGVISANEIVFDNLQEAMAADILRTFMVQVSPKVVVTGGAQQGSDFALSLRQNIFQDPTRGQLINSATGQAFIDPTPGVFGETFIVQQAVPRIRSRQVSSDLLSASNLDLLSLDIGKLGTGTLEIGDGLNNSLFSLELLSAGSVDVDSCEIRNATNDVLATVAGLSGQLQSGTPLIVEFDEASFAAGKRISAGNAPTSSSGGTHFVFCAITSVAPNSTLQAFVGNFSPLGFAIIDNDISVLNVSSQINGLPVSGFVRISP
ncbi:MAG: hypothetical protein P1V18_03190 [Candidatus Gracilibacteria bacterium]|nr:hypothetical protein [Candidatus Gracilibacteria bacterium]